MAIFKVCDFFTKLIYHPSTSDSLLADVFSIMSHLSRKSEDVVVTIIKVLKGSNQQNYQILVKSLSGNPVVKSRCCNMLGNLMRYNDAFYDVLKKNKPIFIDYYYLIYSCDVVNLMSLTCAK